MNGHRAKRLAVKVNRPGKELAETITEKISMKRRKLAKAFKGKPEFVIRVRVLKSKRFTLGAKTPPDYPEENLPNIGEIIRKRRKVNNEWKEINVVRLEIRFHLNLE